MNEQNEPELCLAMAKLLPDLLEPRTVTPCAVGTNQNDKYQVVWWKGKATALLDTEWLYVMHLVEQTLTEPNDVDEYRDELKSICAYYWLSDRSNSPHPEFATFNQRARAMLAVKGGA